MVRPQILSVMRSGCRRRANEAVESLSPSVDFELIVAEVGDDF